MAVTVRLPQALASDADGQRELVVEVGGATRLEDVLAEVSASYPALGRRLCDETGQIRRFVNIYVEDDESRALDGLSSRIPDGAVILVAGSIAGG